MMRVHDALQVEMTEEEFNRIKEEEKAHQRQLRALKEAVRLLERQRSVTSALEEMTTRSRDALEANERLIEEIARDTALNEARLDVALEATDPGTDALEEAGAEARARHLVEQLRRQVGSGGMPEEATPTGEESERKHQASESGQDQSGAGHARSVALPEKTLGRMRSEPDSGDR